MSSEKTGSNIKQRLCKLARTNVAIHMRGVLSGREGSDGHRVVGSTNGFGRDEGVFGVWDGGRRIREAPVATQIGQVGRTGQDTPNDSGGDIQQKELYRGRMNNMERAKREKAEGNRESCCS